MTDVGDGVELTFNTTTGATVTVDVLYGPDLTPVVSGHAVTESPAASGKYPYTVLPGLPGAYEVVFTASGTVAAVESYTFYARALPTRPPLATAEDVAEMWRPLSDAETPLVNALLRRASALLRSNVLDLDARIAAGTLDPDNANTAAVQMVLRVLKNGHGLRQQTVGPFSVTYDKDSAAGYLLVTDADLALFTDVAGQESTEPVSTIRVRAGFHHHGHGRWSERDRCRDVSLR
jgi:hypothetical protein